MIDEINTVVTDGNALRNGFVIRDGFVFTIGKKPAIFDALVIRAPTDAVGPSSRYGFSDRSLPEHIKLINDQQLRSAKIICDNLSFILQCPSLEKVSVYPSHEAEDAFDYSPLYQMPNLRYVNCITKYGLQGQYSSTVDYSKMAAIIDIGAAGNGHVGYDKVPNLERLWLSNSKKHKDLSNISCSTQLKDLTMLQCSIQTLKGIDGFPVLDSLALFHNRSLSDISPLVSNASSLKILAIEGCPKITDFSVLTELINLEHLQLYGANTLPNLNFLHRMIKLKTFTFTMNVQDGDLSNCLQVPYASCKNRKHFNLKDSQLPKQLTK